jgi:hypothetical protein
MLSRALYCFFFLAIGFGFQSYVSAADVKPANKDPLAKFSDEDLAKIDFCFETFCKAIADKDAATAAALIDELPKNLAKLDLTKDADKTTFLKTFAGFIGASVTASQRMPAGGIGQVTYSDKGGAEKTQRMQNVGGRWKLTGL